MVGHRIRALTSGPQHDYGISKNPLFVDFREGCRCEQQYRLHRLLAYDPKNECKGIFSDWFRFPSCCVCKCYGLPSEFRVTSRSPRSRETQWFDTGTVDD